MQPFFSCRSLLHLCIPYGSLPMLHVQVGFENYFLGLEGWLGDEEHWLLVQRTWQFMMVCDSSSRWPDVLF